MSEPKPWMSTIAPPPAPRLGRPRWIDRDAEVDDWDYADDLFPPHALDPEPAPNRLAYAHHLTASQPNVDSELALDIVLDLWMRGRRPFLIRPEEWI